MKPVNDAQTAPMTLAHVAAMLPALYSESSEKANRSALARAEKITGRRLHQISADVAAWQRLTATICWAGHFQARTPAKAEQAWENWRRKIEAIIRKAQDVDAPRRSRAHDAEWQDFAAAVLTLEKMRDDTGAWLLPNMSHLCVATLRARLPDCAPEQIDRTRAEQALISAPPDNKASLKRALAWLDKRIGERPVALVPYLPAGRIGQLPGLRDAKLDWAALPASLVEEIEAAIRLSQKGGTATMHRFDAALGADPVGDARARYRTRAKKSRAPREMEKSIRGALSFLMRHAFEDRAEIGRIASLATLLTPEHIEAASHRFADRASSDPALKPVGESTTLGSWLSTLRSLSRRIRLDASQVEDIDDAVFDICTTYDVALPGQAEMSLTREAFLRRIDQEPQIVKAILGAPEQLAAEARRSFARWDELGEHQRSEALHLCMAAAFAAMQLSRPLRTKNLNMLSEGVGDAQISRGGADGIPWLAIARSEVKNRALLDNPISPRQWRVIELWLDEGREKWCAHRNIPLETPFIFPGETGGAISRGLFNKAWNRGFAMIGIRGLTPHMMRHVCVTLLLARRPGAYGIAADLISDHPDTLRKFYSRAEGAAATRLFAAVLEEIFPDLQLH